LKMRLLLSVLSLFSAIGAYAVDIPKDGGVLVLTEDLFEEALEQHDPLLVEFYAPWCGHCKKLAPEYESAATTLAAEDPPLYVAKVDATEERDLAETYGIKGFPTLKMFSGGKVSDYEGGRTAADIVSYVKKRSGPACTVANTVEELQAVIDGSDVTLVGFLSELSGAEFTTLEATAMGLEDVNCGVTTNADVISHFEASAPGASVFMDFDEGRADATAEDLTDAEKLESLVIANSLPSVIEFDQSLGRKLFGGPVKVHLLVFVDKQAEYFEGVKEALTSTAANNKGKALHIYVPKEEDRVMGYFGFSASDLPAVVLADMGQEGGMKKFMFNGDDVTGDALQSFVDSFFAGDLKPHLKSAEPEDDSDQAVKVIVGSSFEDRVINNDKDVLLEFYAPWCGHCKSLAPKYDELAENFASVDSIMIAKMDATENEIDHPLVNVRGFPTIYFFPSGEKDNPVVYDGSRDVDGFTEYLFSNARVAFELDGRSSGSEDEL